MQRPHEAMFVARWLARAATEIAAWDAAAAPAWEAIGQSYPVAYALLRGRRCRGGRRRPESGNGPTGRSPPSCTSAQYRQGCASLSILRKIKLVALSGHDSTPWTYGRSPAASATPTVPCAGEELRIAAATTGAGDRRSERPTGAGTGP